MGAFTEMLTTRDIMQVFTSELTNLLLSSSDVEKLCKQTVRIEILAPRFCYFTPLWGKGQVYLSLHVNLTNMQVEILLKR